MGGGHSITGDERTPRTLSSFLVPPLAARHLLAQLLGYFWMKSGDCFCLWDSEPRIPCSGMPPQSPSHLHASFLPTSVHLPPLPLPPGNHRDTLSSWDRVCLGGREGRGQVSARASMSLLPGSPTSLVGKALHSSRSSHVQPNSDQGHVVWCVFGVVRGGRRGGAGGDGGSEGVDPGSGV